MYFEVVLDIWLQWSYFCAGNITDHALNNPFTVRLALIVRVEYNIAVYVSI